VQVKNFGLKEKLVDIALIVLIGMLVRVAIPIILLFALGAVVNKHSYVKL
jgi:hypothetical protein